MTAAKTASQFWVGAAAEIVTGHLIVKDLLRLGFGPWDWQNLPQRFRRLEPALVDRIEGGESRDETRKSPSVVRLRRLARFPPKQQLDFGHQRLPFSSDRRRRISSLTKPAQVCVLRRVARLAVPPGTRFPHCSARLADPGQLEHNKNISARIFTRCSYGDASKAQAGARFFAFRSRWGEADDEAFAAYNPASIAFSSRNRISLASPANDITKRTRPWLAVSA